MPVKLAPVLALSLLILTSVRATEAIPKDYKGGGGAAVKDWKPRAYETLKGGLQPLAIYVYDADQKKNALSFHFEGKEALENGDVKEKLSKFAKVKIKNDAKESKGWPEEYVKPADKGALLILMSSDQTIRVVFDKTKETPERSSAAILAAAKVIQAHEDKLKIERAEKAAKEAKAEKALAEARKKDEPPPQFTIDTDKKNPPKKPGDKTADAKKASDPKKKLPDDE